MTRTTYTLKYPVSLGGTEYTELSLRRPRTRDLIKARKSKDELEQMAGLITDLAEIEPKLVQELDAEDFAGLGEVIGNFLPNAAA